MGTSLALVSYPPSRLEERCHSQLVPKGPDGLGKGSPSANPWQSESPRPGPCIEIPQLHRAIHAARNKADANQNRICRRRGRLGKGCFSRPAKTSRQGMCGCYATTMKAIATCGAMVGACAVSLGLCLRSCSTESIKLGSSSIGTDQTGDRRSWSASSERLHARDILVHHRSWNRFCAPGEFM